MDNYSIILVENSFSFNFITKNVFDLTGYLTIKLNELGYKDLGPEYKSANGDFLIYDNGTYLTLLNPIASHNKFQTYIGKNKYKTIVFDEDVLKQRKLEETLEYTINNCKKLLTKYKLNTLINVP